MSTNTSRLKLKKPDGSDPFLRGDFLNTWETLDDYPGDFICTSTTRPTTATWGADQSGMKIFETDTGRTLKWTGSTFVVTNNFGKADWFSISPNLTVAHDTAASRTLGTVDGGRACRLFVIGSVKVTQQDNTRQTSYMHLALDGVDISLDPTSTWQSGDSTGLNAGSTIPVFGYATLSAGAHTLSASCSVGSVSNSPIIWAGAKAFAFYME